MTTRNELIDWLQALPAARSQYQRLNRRYPIALEVEYKLLRKGRKGHRVARGGLGKTLNVSSGGVLFEANEALALPTGTSVELMMHWPFLLRGICPLKLVIRGVVVRSDTKAIAVRRKHHEFRTAKRGSND